MRKIFLLLFITAAPLSLLFSQARPLRVEWGAELETSEVVNHKAGDLRFMFPRIVQDEADELMMIVSKTVQDWGYNPDKTTYFIVKLDKKDQFKIKEKIEIVYPESIREGGMLEDVLIKDSQLWLFVSFTTSSEDGSEKADRFFQVYLFKYNLTTGKIIGQERKIIDLVRKGSGILHYFELHESPDGDHFVGEVEIKPGYTSNFHRKHHYSFFNSDFELLESREEMVITKATIFEHLVDREGSLYFIRNTKNEGANLVSYNANLDYEKWEEPLDFNNIPGIIKDATIKSPKLKLNSDNDVILSGFYGETQEEDGYNVGNIKGAYFWKINSESKEAEIKTIQPFKEEFLESLTNPFFKKKMSFSKMNFGWTIIEMKPLKNGEMLIIAEESDKPRKYFTSVEDSWGNNGKALVMKFGTNGDLIWKTPFPKSRWRAYSFLNEETV